MANASRDQIRSKLFSEKRKSRTITLDNGLQVEIRQTSVGEMMNTVESEDRRERLVHLMIVSCFVPETEERIFELGDMDAIMEMPSGGYYQKLLDAINEDTLSKKVDTAKKSSGGEAANTTSN